jgi:hypothetical protein
VYKADCSPVFWFCGVLKTTPSLEIKQMTNAKIAALAAAMVCAVALSSTMAALWAQGTQVSQTPRSNEKEGFDKEADLIGRKAKSEGAIKSFSVEPKMQLEQLKAASGEKSSQGEPRARSKEELLEQARDERLKLRATIEFGRIVRELEKKRQAAYEAEEARIKASQDRADLVVWVITASLIGLAALAVLIFLVWDSLRKKVPPTA